MTRLNKFPNKTLAVYKRKEIFRINEDNKDMLMEEAEKAIPSLLQKILFNDWSFLLAKS